MQLESGNYWVCAKVQGEQCGQGLALSYMCRELRHWQLLDAHFVPRGHALHVS